MLKKVIGGTFWNASATFAQLLLQLVVLALLGRLLLPAHFGIVGVATAVAAFAGLVGQLGIGQALIQRERIDTQTIRAGFTLSALAGGAVVALVCLFAAPLAAAFNMPEAAPYIRVVSFSVLGLSLGTTADALLQREMRFREVGLIAVASYLVGYVFIAVPLAASGYGAWALAWAAFAQPVSKAVLSLVRRPHSVVPLFATSGFRRLLSFGGRVTVSKLLNSLALQGDNLLVARALGPQALGLYSRSYQLMLIPVQLIGQTMATALYPAMSQAQSRRTVLREAYLTAAGLSTLLGGITSALFVLLAPQIVSAVLGSGWEGAVLPLRILSVVIMLRVAYKLDDTLAKATGALDARLVRDLTYALAIVGGVLFAVRFGVEGAAVAVGCAIVLNHALGVALSLRITGLRLADYLISQRATLLLTPLALLVGTALRGAVGLLTSNPVLTIVLVTSGVAVGLLLLVAVFPKVLDDRQRRLLDAGLSKLPEGPVRRTLAALLGGAR